MRLKWLNVPICQTFLLQACYGNHMPDLKRGAAAWILAGGAHHTGFSTSINSEYLEDFAGMMGIEYVLIGENCDLTSFKNELRWNEIYYHLAGGII